MVEIAQTDDMKARMGDGNAVVPLQTPEDMAKHLLEDTKANLEVITAAISRLSRGSGASPAATGTS